MSDQIVDAYGHIGPVPNAPALAAGTFNTPAAGKIVAATNAGASSTITAVTAIDQYGSFTINSVGTPAAGVAASVRFAQSFEATPRSVQITVVDITAPTTPAAVAAYAQNVTSAGFDVTVPALTTAHSYLVNYEVQV